MSEGAREEEQAEGGDGPAGKASPRDPDWRAAALVRSVLRAQGELFVLVTQSVLKDDIEPATDKLFAVVDFPPAGKGRQEALR